MIWYKNFRWKEIKGEEIPDYLASIQNLFYVFRGVNKNLSSWPSELYFYVWGRRPEESEEYQVHNDVYPFEGCTCDNCTEFNETFEINYILSFPQIGELTAERSSIFYRPEIIEMKFRSFMETFPHPQGQNATYRIQLTVNPQNHPYISHAPHQGYGELSRNINPTFVEALEWMEQTQKSINYPGGI